ncbi:MAG TPA: beta/gamma crystallin domain-containing protein [Nitrospiraceae bacterium]|nr:beta/gamma crystallin domain-containing protein [Nitrospiraceae bacterium]
MLRTMMSAVLIVGFAASTSAADTELQLVDKACWIEIFEDDNYDKDDPHLQIQGPAEFASLKDLKGRNWNNDIESVIVGPGATVKAYKDKDFKGTEIAFTSNQRVPDLAKLDMANEIESMKVMCQKS